MNPDELFALTGLTGHDGIKQLQKLGIEYVIYTNKKEISLLVKDKLYTIFLPKMTLTDTTGIGDIFCSTFTCTMLKEKDFLWALSFAGGAAQSALESKAFGLEKVPEKNALESNGSYFYNIVVEVAKFCFELGDFFVILVVGDHLVKYIKFLVLMKF